MRINIVIAHLSSASILLPLMLSLMNWRRLGEMRPLFLIILISFLTDAASLIYPRYSILLGNFYLMSQFCILVWLFRREFYNKKIVDITFSLFLVFYFVNIFFLQGAIVINSAANAVACLILITCCLYYFYRLLNDLPTVHILNLPMLWISFGVLTYYAGNFFVFLVSNYLVTDAEMHREVWIFHNLLNTIKNILFAVALWQSYRKTRLSTLSSSVP